MTTSIYDYINPIKVCVFITLLFAFLFLRRTTRTNSLLYAILWVSFGTEVVNSVLLYLDYSIRIAFSVSILFHHLLWLLLLLEYVTAKKGLRFAIISFVVFGVVNLVGIETVNKYNYYTFVYGALLYILFFIYESYIQLQQENVTFFISNSFIVLFAPLLFFFGLSLMFGFRDVRVTSTLIFGAVTLYNFMIHLVCIFYYTLLNIYLFREKSIRHG